MAASFIGCSNDLLPEILIHLPPKTLLRFKLVSKQWNFLISDRGFAINHSRNAHINPISVLLPAYFSTSPALNATPRLFQFLFSGTPPAAFRLSRRSCTNISAQNSPTLIDFSSPVTAFCYACSSNFISAFLTPNLSASSATRQREISEFSPRRRI